MVATYWAARTAWWWGWLRNRWLGLRFWNGIIFIRNGLPSNLYQQRYFSNNSNSIENSFCGHVYPVTINFCTCHDSCAVVACAKFLWNHFFVRFWRRWKIYEIYIKFKSWNIVVETGCRTGIQGIETANSLVPRKCSGNFECVIFKNILITDILSISIFTEEKIINIGNYLEVLGILAEVQGQGQCPR